MRSGIVWLLRMAALIGLIPVAVVSYQVTDYYLPDSVPTPFVWVLGGLISVMTLHLYSLYLTGLFFQLDNDTSIHHVWIVVCVVKWVLFFGLGIISVPLCIYFAYEAFLHLVKAQLWVSVLLGGFFGFGISLVLQEGVITMYMRAIADKVGRTPPRRRR